MLNIQLNVICQSSIECCFLYLFLQVLTFDREKKTLSCKLKTKFKTEKKKLLQLKIEQNETRALFF